MRSRYNLTRKTRHLNRKTLYKLNKEVLHLLDVLRFVLGHITPVRGNGAHMVYSTSEGDHEVSNVAARIIQNI